MFESMWSGIGRLMRAIHRGVSAAKLVGIFILIVCLTLSAFEAKRLLDARDEAMVKGRRNVVNLANSLIDHAEQALRTADAILISLKERVDRDGLDSAAMDRLRDLFEDEVRQIPQFKSLAVVDEHGAQFPNGRQDPRVSNVADRDYFRHHAAVDDSRIYVGAPVQGKRPGEWAIPISRRVNKPGGEFGGVVMVFVDPEYFQRFYEEFDLGQHGSILLASDRGTLLVRRPFVEANVGRDLGSSGIFAELKRAPSGSAEIRSSTDGVVRINGYAHGKTYPIVVAAAESTDDILESWWLKTEHELLELAVALGALGLLGVVIWRMTRALDRRAEEIETTAARFKTAIDNMSHGMCLFDAQQRVVVANDRYAEIYGLTPEQLRPGTTKRTILGHLERAGTHFTADPDAYIANNLRRRSEVQELADGRFIAITRHPMPDGGWLTVHEDVTERATRERRVTYLAEHDVLTGLLNRVALMSILDGEAAEAATATGRFAVFMLDLDRFKEVNDTCGHQAGDKVLVEVARRLRSSLRESDIVARLGGDEFAIIQPLVDGDKSSTVSLASRIAEILGQPFDLDGRLVSVGASMGIAFAPVDATAPKDLLKKADLALYATKRAGRGSYRLFSQEMIENSEEQAKLESELRKAIESGQFELHYQPLFETSSRRTVGAEALVRWRHPDRGLLPPSQFIPAAESSGLIVQLGEWVLRQACRDASAWPPHYHVAVNLSAVQFDKGHVLQQVRRVLADTGLAPQRLELEVTESAMLAGQPAHLETMRELKKLGIRLALDDFGTGYASARYLIDYPFDRIKIDRSFVADMLERRECAAVVAAVLTLAQTLGKEVTAEGVEKEEQMQFLRSSGVNLAQGYLLGKPAPLSEFLAESVSQPQQRVA